MKNTSLTNSVSPILELEALSEKAANAFKSFLEADSFDLHEYKRFLNTMFHYTARSGEMISHAGKVSHDEVLKEFFGHMLSEEKGHYLLAKEDLKALGDDISEDIPPAVISFHKRWFNLGDNIYPYLGAVYVFENIAKHIQVEGRQLFERLSLTKKQRRWIAVHLEADLDHGNEIIEICRHYYHLDPPSFLAGGKVMCDSWINVFTGFSSK